MKMFTKLIQTKHNFFPLLHVVKHVEITYYNNIIAPVIKTSYYFLFMKKRFFSFIIILIAFITYITILKS